VLSKPSAESFAVGRGQKSVLEAVRAPVNHFEALPASEDLVEVTATLHKKPRRPRRTYKRVLPRPSTSLEAAGNVFSIRACTWTLLEAEAVFEAAAASRGIWRSYTPLTTLFEGRGLF
jgi:hypothetical protein